MKHRIIRKWFRYWRRRWDAATAKLVQRDPQDVRDLTHSAEFKLPVIVADWCHSPEPMWARIAAPTTTLAVERLIVETRVAHWITRVGQP